VPDQKKPDRLGMEKKENLPGFWHSAWHCRWHDTFIFRLLAGSSANPSRAAAAAS
jgi:hypothetical protein